MVEIDKTCMKVVLPGVMFVNPLGYQVTKTDIIEYYIELLKEYIDDESEKWGTAEERFSITQQL